MPHSTPVDPNLTWHKSSRCGTSTCVEVAYNSGHYLIRDSKNPDQPPLRFDQAEWDAFIAGVTGGEFRFSCDDPWADVWP